MMIESFLRRLLPLGVILVASWPVAAMAEDCLKQVFNRFCLGGDAKALAAQQPPDLRIPEGERLGLVYSDGLGRLFVMSQQDRIYKVLRQYLDEGLRHFEEIRDTVIAKYGAAEDHSSISPELSQAPANRLSAIRRGEARILMVWKPTGETWRLELAWTQEFGITLAYIASQLEPAATPPKADL
ncbi:Chalcone isomerase domain-containing protein [Gammaproteobacteria bacterium]